MGRTRKTYLKIRDTRYMQDICTYIYIYRQLYGPVVPGRGSATRLVGEVVRPQPDTGFGRYAMIKPEIVFPFMRGDHARG